MNIVIIPNEARDKDYKYTKELINIIADRANILMEKKHAVIGMDVKFVDEAEILEKSDAAIALGGDGTILSAAKALARYDVPVLGINLGHLGFLAEVEPACMKEAVDSLVGGRYIIENRAMIKAKVYRSGEVIAEFHALNDIVVSRATFSRLLGLKTSVGTHLLDSFVADGVILSTPTGSTAYSLSAGGPILDPSLEVMLINPVCPHTMHTRPMVVPLDSEVKVELEKGHYNEDAFVSADGAEGIKLMEGDIVWATKSRYFTKLIKITDQTFYDTVRLKLSERGIVK